MSLLILLLFLGLGGALRPVASAADEQFVYSGFRGAYLSLDGMDTVTPEGLLMLTDGTNQLGHAFYPAPLWFHRAPNSTAMESFVIGIIGRYDELSSHGMAFVIAKNPNFTSELPGKYLGLVSSATNGNASNHLFAVEFDTVQNREFNDMRSNHVGIDVNGLISVTSDNAGYYDCWDKPRHGCVPRRVHRRIQGQDTDRSSAAAFVVGKYLSPVHLLDSFERESESSWDCANNDDATGAFRDVSLVSGRAMQVWVDFDGRTMQVNVTMTPLKVARPKRPLLSTTVNLSSVIDDTVYVGFSSATDILFSRHYVLGWSFRMNGAAPPLNVSSLPSLPVPFPKSKSNSRTLAIALFTASMVLVFAVAAAVVFVLMRRRRRMYAEVKEDWEDEFGPHRFPYKDLFHATDGFSDRRLLGTGGFGSVYRGVLASKAEVAVKKVAQGSRQGMREFVAEVVSIGRHRHLAQLLGYCRRNGELLLVYDYMPNGSLDRHLHDQSKAALSWAQRFRVIRGVAAGLLFLHEGWEQVVVHRDVKPSNVLLDGDMDGRLGDFGLARLYDRGANPQATTHVASTLGYLAPELQRTGKPTPATDVFAFSVFVLEVACGRRPLGRVSPPDDDQSVLLLDWVQEHERRGAALATVDPRLRGEYDAGEALTAIRMGLMCAYPLLGARPRMRQVVQYLEGDAPTPDVARTDVSYTALALMQYDGLDSSKPLPSGGGVSAVSGLSGGR
ncbi:hypothetical protein ACP70R_015720 [Stipagrostis hirtigluma subsp. patula]